MTARPTKAAEAREIRDAVIKCLMEWAQRRTREFSVALGANHSDLVITAWHADTPERPVTFRVPYRDLTLFGPRYAIECFQTYLPLRTPHLRRGAAR